MAKMESTKTAILAGVETELDRRRIGSQAHFNKEEILEAMTSMHTEMLKKVDLCVCDSSQALKQVVPCFDVPTGDVPEFVVNDGEEQPLTFVPNNDHAAGDQ